VSTRILAKQAI